MASKFVLIAGDRQFELHHFESPRGLRNKDKRPDRVIIESREEFNLVNLQNYIRYLETIACALTEDGEQFFCDCPDDENSPIKFICTKCGKEFKAD